jgi:hypothetical protein
MIRAPASIVSMMALASSPGLALGMAVPEAKVSVKIGRTRTVQSGQMLGAGDERLAAIMPTTKVPCAQATLSVREHPDACLGATFCMCD